ncbi:MAG: PTS sugar transporter subunit IIA [Erysipelotrichaceae bacterium]|nr:PTS sugar transporter subunit IIA [Erysipelotrichaceae bacterium]MDY5251617.1 PTS sugar transporter subunit IIA [Erysipelotrichaceae bacterium]
MKNILLISHGPLAEALIASAAMLYGKKENVAFYGLNPEDNIAEFENKIFQYVEEHKENDIIIMCDISGGSPYNCASKIKFRYPNIEIVSGMNVAMVLEVFLSEEYCTLKELVLKAENAGKESVCIAHIDNNIIKDEMDEMMEE